MGSETVGELAAEEISTNGGGFLTSRAEEVEERVPFSTFLVATHLSFSSFDDVRTGLALIRNVRAEVVRLAKVDDRLQGVTSNVNRRERTVEIVLRVRALSETEAADLGIASLRASIHAAGGCTAHWQGNSVLLAPAAGSASAAETPVGPGARWRRRHDDVRTGPIRHAVEPSWARAADEVARTARPAAPLPSLDDVEEPIDLR